MLKIEQERRQPIGRSHGASNQRSKMGFDARASPDRFAAVPPAPQERTTPRRAVRAMFSMKVRCSREGMCSPTSKEMTQSACPVASFE